MKAANVVGEGEQPIPLFHVERDRHALQAVDAQAPFFADFAVERAPLRLFDLAQQLGGLVDLQFTGGQLGKDFFFLHGLSTSTLGKNHLANKSQAVRGSPVQEMAREETKGQPARCEVGQADGEQLTDERRS